MPVRYSTAVRNAQLDAKEAVIGQSPLLRVYSGAEPASCAAAVAVGNALLCEIALPSDWLTAASGGTKSKSGTWDGVGAVTAGTGRSATFYRIYDSTGAACHEQGTVTVTGGGGQMELDNVSIATGQAVSISAYQFTAGNS